MPETTSADSTTPTTPMTAKTPRQIVGLLHREQRADGHHSREQKVERDVVDGPPVGDVGEPGVVADLQQYPPQAQQCEGRLRDARIEVLDHSHAMLNKG